MSEKEMQQQVDAVQEVVDVQEVAKEAAEPEVVETKALQVIPQPEDVMQKIEESEESLDTKAEMLCRWAAGRAGVIVVAPVLGTVALMANEVYLVNRLARLYKKDITEGAILSFLGAFGGTLAGNVLATLIPFSGVQIPIAVGVTYAVGKAAQAWIKEGMPQDLEPYVEIFKEWRDKAKSEAQVLAKSPLKNIPLGDEHKDYLRDSGQKISEKLQDMRQKVGTLLETSLEALAEGQETLSEKAQEVKEKTVATAGVIKDRASEKAGEIKEKASEKAEMLKDNASLGVDMLRDKSQVAAIHTASALSDLAVKIQDITERTKAKIEEKRANAALDEELTELRHLVEEARLLAEELKSPTDISLSEIDEAGSDLDALIREALRDAEEASHEVEEEHKDEEEKA